MGNNLHFGLCIFGFLIILIVLAFLILIMGATIVGSLTRVVLVMLLISLVGTSLGVLFTSISRTKNQTLVYCRLGGNK